MRAILLLIQILSWSALDSCNALLERPHFMFALARDHADLAAGPEAALDSIQRFVKRVNLSSLPVVILLHENLRTDIAHWRELCRGRGFYARSLQIPGFVERNTILSLRPHVADLFSSALHEVSDPLGHQLFGSGWCVQRRNDTSTSKVTL